MYYSKKVKLPKSEWVKGKSKFLHIREIEDAHRKVIPPAIRGSWLKRVYARLRLLTKITQR